MSRPAIIVMAKAPRAGEAKTRLVPPLTRAEAAALAACFVRDACATARLAASDVLVAYAPSDGRASLEPILADAPALWLEQRGADLGARLASAAAEAFAQGFGPVVLVGSDSPTLPPDFLRAALDALASGAADVTLGPTDDGGYYAVGLGRPAPRLFRSVGWSSPRALADTAANAARLGLRLAQLPRWYDVDTPADLRRLREELAADEHARARAPSTSRWLQARLSVVSGL
jgi:rSAM/selenodomain-associated transferase 1